MTKRTRRRPKDLPQQQPNAVGRALTALGIAVVVLLLVVGGLWVISPRPAPIPTATPIPEGSPFTLTLLHTNDTWGYTQPCG